MPKQLIPSTSPNSTLQRGEKLIVTKTQPNKKETYINANPFDKKRSGLGLDCPITFISEHKFSICHSFLIVIVPNLQESVYERMKKAGGATPFNLFVISEMECMHRLLAAVRETLLVSEQTIFVFSELD